MTANWISALGSIAAFLTAIATLIGVFRTHRAVGETKELVNGKADEQIARGDQLTAALTAAGVDVPPRPATEGT